MVSIESVDFYVFQDFWQRHGVLPAARLGAALLLAYCLGRAIYLIWFHPLSRFPGPAYMCLTPFPYLYNSHVKGSWVRDVVKLHRSYGPAVRIGPGIISLDGTIGWPEVYGHRAGGGKVEFEKTPRPLLVDGHEILILASRNVHRRQRRQLAQAFSDSALAGYESVVRGYVDSLLDRLVERARKGETVDIVSWLNAVTFDIIGHLAFSESFSCLENNGHHPWVSSIFDSIRGNSLRRFLQHYPPLGWLVETLGLSSSLSKAAHVHSAAKDKARARIRLGPDPVDGRQDMTAYMMKNTTTHDEARGISEGEMLANAPTLVIAGSETTGTALSGLCFYLARNEDVYHALADEIRTAFGRGGDVDLRVAASLEYLGACINEVLRVYPPAAETMPRISPGVFINGVYVPEGTTVHVYQWATFHNPNNFLDADSFIPERWLSKSHARYQERFATDNRAVFKPFSFGPRDCIGRNLAMFEMRLIICRLLCRFDFELEPGQDSWQRDQRTFDMWRKTPLRLRLHDRLS
ncbi:hypothetical protein L249_0399 [Ophiocordyceps polyrhachis-furcata BCC 54312]|uniref:Cytochrome P450 monooxygenase n=1 Tax=Ophiocordyceps polyrhachis-furcata BCC 54312 TaxID=1330021 RepID=A0A367LEH8_9HYPO|nr:hypothetical protein L249_0399 [Ophiocordyceps polyrhachis-furcata BCC 54312]